MRRFLLVVLAFGCSIGEMPTTEPYDRSAFGRWVDADGDCQDTRQEVLIAESEVPVTFTDDRECRVATGRWTCPLTGEVQTDPGKLDIDHTVALRDAWDMGWIWVWPEESRLAFANNLEVDAVLEAVSRSANRSKGARGPDAWLPPLEEARCPYIRRWLLVAKGYRFQISPERRAVINYMQTACARDEIPPRP